jgi:hypothetical protein
MRHFERRLAAAFPYFKLAKWDAVSFTWRDGRQTFETQAAAEAAADRPGRYRISAVDETGRHDLAPFDR